MQSHERQVIFSRRLKSTPPGKKNYLQAPTRLKLRQKVVTHVHFPSQSQSLDGLAPSHL
jgi:hypothetical protein